MKLLFVSVGKKHDAVFAEAIEDFTKRIGHYADVEWKILSPEESVEKEGKVILSLLSERDYTVLLDVRGKELDSTGLAAFFTKRLNAGTYRTVFIIGGAYGVSDAVHRRVEAALSFSKLTFPHQLMRLILAEQVYRAFTILKGERYHHA